jgi:hypothetical protein
MCVVHVLRCGVCEYNARRYELVYLLWLLSFSNEVVLKLPEVVINTLVRTGGRCALQVHDHVSLTRRTRSGRVCEDAEEGEDHTRRRGCACHLLHVSVGLRVCCSYTHLSHSRACARLHTTLVLRTR